MGLRRGGSWVSIGLVAVLGGAALPSCGGSSGGSSSGLDGLRVAVADAANIRTAVRTGVVNAVGAQFLGNKGAVQPQVDSGFYIPADFSIVTSANNCNYSALQPQSSCPLWSVTGTFPTSTTITQTVGLVTQVTPGYNFTVSLNAPGNGCNRTLFIRDLAGDCPSSGMSGTVIGTESHTYQSSSLSQGTDSSNVNEQIRFPDGNWVTLVGSGSASISGNSASSNFNSDEKWSNGQRETASSSSNFSGSTSGLYSWTYQASSESDTNRSYTNVNVTFTILAADSNQNPTKIQVNGTVTVGGNSSPDGKLTLTLSGVILDLTCNANFRRVTPNGGSIAVSGDGSASLIVSSDCSGDATLTVNNVLQQGSLNLGN